ncbi:MAG: ribonuclease, Rne/Rng family, partial [Gaiellaceae bacterium]|nr:ribonuclease, Rne/Rng family [Gaiellaceae bacterium]
EMTRQNVTDGPREILTKKCPTCAGDGIVVSEATAAVDLERKLRAVAAAKPRTKAFRVEVSARAGSILIGPGASRLEQIEATTKRRFFLELKDGLHSDHFAVLEEGTLEKLAPKTDVQEGAELELKLVEVGLYDPNAAVAKLDGLAVVVAGAAKLVGKTVQARVNRVLDGTAYAAVVGEPAAADPITAEREAEKPTRASRAKVAPDKPAVAEKPVKAKAEPIASETPAGGSEEAEVVETEAVEEAAEDGAETPAPKKKTRRGSRGGRRRRKTGTAAAASANGGAPADDGAPRIHIPDRELDEEPDDEPAEATAESEPSEDGAETKPKKKTRRGSRGGRRRRKPAGPTTVVAEQADDASETAA